MMAEADLKGFRKEWEKIYLARLNKLFVRLANSKEDKPDHSKTTTGAMLPGSRKP
jgi:hypothetical protein